MPAEGPHRGSDEGPPHEAWRALFTVTHRVEKKKGEMLRSVPVSDLRETMTDDVTVAVVDWRINLNDSTLGLLFCSVVLFTWRIFPSGRIPNGKIRIVHRTWGLALLRPLFGIASSGKQAQLVLFATQLMMDERSPSTKVKRTCGFRAMPRLRWELCLDCACTHKEYTHVRGCGVHTEWR